MINLTLHFRPYSQNLNLKFKLIYSTNLISFQKFEVLVVAKILKYEKITFSLLFKRIGFPTNKVLLNSALSHYFSHKNINAKTKLRFITKLFRFFIV